MKVLIPLDGTPASEASLDYLPLLKAFGDLEVRLLGIALPELRGEPGGEGSIEHLNAHLMRQELRLRGAGFAVDRVVRIGAPALDIVNEADRLGAQLTIMSAHTRSDMQRWRRGSVTDAVARIALQDLFIVPAVTERPPQLRNLLVPLDGSGVAENALPAAVQWTLATNARLHLMQVVTTATVAHDGAEAHSHSQPENSESYLNRLLTEPTLAQAITSVTHGLPTDRLIEYSQGNEIDVVAMTAHGWGRGSRVGLGRTAEGLLRSGRPVLLLRSWEAY